ncbi:MAG: hypothetical protein RLZZ428_1022 [Pseudomonadota bacterium]
MLEKSILNILENPKKKTIIFAAMIGLFLFSIATFPLEIVKAKMLPGKDSNTFSLYVDLPNGSAIKDTREVTACIANILQKEEIVLSTSVFLGQGQPLDFAGMVKGSSLKFEQNQAEMMVNIKKAEERDEKSFKFIQRVRPIVQNTCSLHHANIKFVELPSGPPTLADVVVEVYGGKSSDSRRFFAQKIADILKAQKTLVDIDTLEDEPTKTFELVLNNNKVIESGIGMQQIKRMIYIAIEGSDVGIINDANAQNQIPIFVRIGGDSRLLLRGDKESIQAQTQKLKLMNPSGLAIPLSYFVNVVEKDTIPAIRSKNLKKTTTVFATTDMESQIYPLLDARKMMLEVLSDQYDITKTNLLNLHFEDKKTKESFDIVWDGELKVTIDTFIDLGVAFIGALVLIFLLMVVYYHSYALSAAIVLSSFLSIIGVIWGHFVMDLLTADRFYLTATSLIGFIGLIGINSRNSLLIIDFAKELMKRENYSANKAIAVATATRAKPILLTVLAIVFASTLLARDAVFGGLGVALIGGTLFAYLVSIYFVPLTIQNSLKALEEK